MINGNNEVGDSVDYPFFSEISRKLYSVGFDRSASSSFEEFSEILVEHGYPMLFSAKTVETPPPDKTSVDPSIRERISVIVRDFLASSPKETFVVYECEAHLDRGIFKKWFDQEANPEYVKRSATVVIPTAEGEGVVKSMSIGFITRKTNPHLHDAEKDLDFLLASFL